MQFGMFTCIVVSSLVGRRVFPTHQTAHTDSCKHTKLHMQPVSLRMNPRGSKHVRYTKN